MPIRQTHTYVTLEISKAAYDEIAGKLREAGYDHVFNDDGEIDMHGLALVPPDPKNDTFVRDAFVRAKICSCAGHQQPRCVHFRMGRCADKDAVHATRPFSDDVGGGP